MRSIHFDWITIPAGECWIGSDPAQDPLAFTKPPARLARRCFAAILHTYAWVEIWTALGGEFAQGQPRAGALVRQMTEFLFPPAVFGPPD